MHKISHAVLCDYHCSLAVNEEMRFNYQKVLAGGRVKRLEFTLIY